MLPIRIPDNCSAVPGGLAFRKHQVYSLDIQLNTLKFGKVDTRMCGKFTDCLMEIGGEGDELEPIVGGSHYTTPNVTIPVEYTTVKSEVPETGNPIVWTFDKDGCPLTATETLNYQEYKVTYNIVVGDTVQWVDQREDANGNPIVTKYYDFTTTPEQYTKTSNSWSCPKVLTVTYR